LCYFIKELNNTSGQGVIPYRR